MNLNRRAFSRLCSLCAACLSGESPASPKRTRSEFSPDYVDRETRGSVGSAAGDEDLHRNRLRRTVGAADVAGDPETKLC
jgi:hypothetical protein